MFALIRNLVISFIRIMLRHLFHRITYHHFLYIELLTVPSEGECLDVLLRGEVGGLRNDGGC